jgi:hypothetical protein
MHILHLRFQTEDDHTKSTFIIDGKFYCFILEDGFNVIKVKGETRITPATREIKLRTEGGMHQDYLEKYGKDFHKGMLWIKNVHNYKYVYIHKGNYPKDTLGCLLTNYACDTNKKSMSQSEVAYKKIYPIISDAILNGEKVEIETVDIQQIL